MKLIYLALIAVLSMSCASTNELLTDNKKVIQDGVTLTYAKKSMIEPKVEQTSILACVKNEDAITNNWHCDNQIFSEQQINESNVFKRGDISVLIRNNLMSAQFSVIWGFYQAKKDLQIPLGSPICNVKMSYSKKENFSGDSNGVCYFEFKKHASTSKE